MDKFMVIGQHNYFIELRELNKMLQKVYTK